MIRKAISTDMAPAAVGPYSQGIRAGGELLFLSGQIPLDPASGKLVEGGIEAQTEQACRNVGALLASQGLDFGNVVKTTVFLADMKDFPIVNNIYARYFSAPCPARSCVQVGALPLGALVEIESIAVI